MITLERAFRKCIQSKTVDSLLSLSPAELDAVAPLMKAIYEQLRAEGAGTAAERAEREAIQKAEMESLVALGRIPRDT